MAFSVQTLSSSVLQAPKALSKGVKAAVSAPKAIQDTVSSNISKLNNLGKRMTASDEYLKGWSGSHSSPAAVQKRPKRKPIDAKVDVKLEFLPADKALGYGIERSSQSVRNGLKAMTGANQTEAADKQAAELEQLKRERFEEKLKSQNPKRYESYKKQQITAEKSIRDDKNPETHRRREFRVNERSRERAVLVKDPLKWKSSLPKETRQKLQVREEHDLRSLENSSAPSAADESALRAKLARNEAKVLPGKKAWMEQLPAEKRQEYLQREKLDTASILDSGMKANEAKDVLKDVATLGANSAQKRDGVTGAAKELSTLGLHGLAKSGGEDLGSGSAYLEQDKNLRQSGAYIDAQYFQKEGEKAQNRGILTTGTALIGANSARPMLRNAVKRAQKRVRVGLAKRSKIKRQVDTGGLRGEKALTEAQKADIIALSEKLGVPKDRVHFWSRNTSYGDTFDMVMVGTDIMPSMNPKGVGTSTVNQRLGWKEALNHEIVGHRAAALKGKTHPPMSALDEAQASIRAARFGEELTRVERIRLLRDGVNRLRQDGLRVRDVRDKLWITEK